VLDLLITRFHFINILLASSSEMEAIEVQRKVIMRLWDGLDWLAQSKRGRRITYGAIIVVSIGICLAFVLPDAGFVPGWQPAVAKIVSGGTEVWFHGKMLGLIKGNFGLPPTIWIELTKKADYYEAQRPIYGHGLLVAPLVITAISSVVVVVLLSAWLARHRRRYFGGSR
jgi:hypothetical protein